MKEEVLNLISQGVKRKFQFGKIDEENRTVELSFSSDIKLERWPGFFEVLSHDPDSVDLSRLNDGAPLLFNHDMDRVIGVIEGAKIENERKGRALVRFASDDDSEKFWRQVKDGILRNVSVGYRINEIKLTEENDKGEVYTVTRWQPYEISIVSVPADPTVGIGRSLNNFKQEKKEKIMDPKAIEVNEPALRQEGVKTEQQRSKQILDAGRQYGVLELATEFVANGRSFEDFQGELVKKMEEKTRLLRDSGKADLSKKDVEKFSVLKLVRAISSQTGERTVLEEDAKFEFEACAAAAKNMHRTAKGFVIPLEVLTAVRADAAISIKTGSGYGGGAASLVPTTLASQSFVEMLRNKSVLMKYATPLTGLVGNLQIPRQTSKTTAYYVGENTEPTRDDIGTALLNMSPKTIGCTADLTRSAINQSSLDMEAFVRAQLAKGLGEGTDFKGFYADAASSIIPRGLKLTSGINSVVFASPATPTYPEIVGMETKISTANADTPNMVYIGNSKFRGHCKTTQKFSGTNGQTIWRDEDNTVNGYNVEITNQIADNEVFFGNFSDFIVGMWGGLDIMADPYSNSKKGMLSITMFQDHDFLVLRPESFCFGGAAL